MTREPEKRAPIRKQIDLDVPPERAWDAWALPEEIARWFVDRAAGKAEKGGEMLWAWDEPYGFEHAVEVLEAERGRRLLLRMTWAGVITVLDVQLEPFGQGARVTLAHSGFLDGDDWDHEYEGASFGWTEALALLKEYVEHWPGRQKRRVDVLREADFEFPAFIEAATTGDGLMQWIAEAGDVVEIERQASDRPTPERAPASGGGT